MGVPSRLMGRGIGASAALPPAPPLALQPPPPVPLALAFAPEAPPTAGSRGGSLPQLPSEHASRESITATLRAESRCIGLAPWLPRAHVLIRPSASHCVCRRRRPAEEKVLPTQPSVSCSERSARARDRHDRMRRKVHDSVG